jgi:hypothetical protein
VTAVAARSEPINADMVRDAQKAEARTRNAVARKEKEGDAQAIAKAQDAHAEAAARLARRTEALDAALHDIRVVMGVDPGKRNAMSVVSLRVPEGESVSLDRVLALGGKGKEEMREFFSTHALPNPERAEAAWSYENASFLGYAEDIAEAIIAASIAIDARYRRITTLKVRVNAILGRPPGTHVSDVLPDDASVELKKGHRAFFREWGRMRKRKEERIKLWERLAAAKKCWFGMLANRLAVSALALGAGVAFEDGDWGVAERGSADYRGRIWNRIMSSVSQRAMMDVAKARLDWSGVVWWTVASYHTSTTDHRHGTTASGQRKNGAKDFIALTDGMRMDSDEHAAETMAAAALLRPLLPKGQTPLTL